MGGSSHASHGAGLEALVLAAEEGRIEGDVDAAFA